MSLSKEERDVAIGFIEWLSDDDISLYALMDDELEKRQFIEFRLLEFAGGPEAAFDEADLRSQRAEGLPIDPP